MRYFSPVYVFGDKEQLILSVLKSSADSNACARFDAITCEHPHLNTSRLQRVNGWLHVELELILDAWNAKKSHILFKLSNAFLNLHFSRNQVILRPLVIIHEFFELRLGDDFLGEGKRSKTIRSQLITKLKQSWSLTRSDHAFHYDLCTFDVVDDFTSFFLFYQDGHFLTLTREREICENLVILIVSIWVTQLNRSPISFNQL